MDLVPENAKLMGNGLEIQSHVYLEIVSIIVHECMDYHIVCAVECNVVWLNLHVA